MKAVQEEIKSGKKPLDIGVKEIYDIYILKTKIKIH